jgi:hypothetical protein
VKDETGYLILLHHTLKTNDLASSKMMLNTHLSLCVEMKTNCKNLNYVEQALIQLSLDRDCTQQVIALSHNRSASYVRRDRACELPSSSG